MVNAAQHDGGGGSAMPEMIKLYEIIQIWETLKRKVTSVWTNDERWVAEQTAKVVADGAWCEEMENFNQQVSALQTRFDTVIPEIDQLLRGSFGPHDGVAEKLLEHKDKWNTVWTKVNQVHSDVETHLKMDQWTGKGGEEYKAVLPTQMKALIELRGLASSQSQSCDQAGLMNAWIFQRTRDAVSQVNNVLPPVCKARPNIAGSGHLTTINGTLYSNYRFAVDSMKLAANLESLRDWLKKVIDPYTSDWSGPANSLQQDINTVATVPVNLQPEGKWPGIKMRVQAPAASTGSLGYNNTNVSGNNQVNNNDDIRMNV